jgi:hypothetical protein
VHLDDVALSCNALSRPVASPTALFYPSNYVFDVAFIIKPAPCVSFRNPVQPMRMSEELRDLVVVFVFCTTIEGSSENKLLNTVQTLLTQPKAGLVEFNPRRLPSPINESA